MKRVIIIFFIAALSVGFNASDRVAALIKKEVKSVFQIETYTTSSLFIADTLNNTLPVKITDKNFFKIKDQDKLLGYYYLGRAFGKADYFDFIVIFDTNLIVAKVKVLVYREDHGGEVGSKRWLRQFKGKSQNSTLKYQKNIAAISGATLSARSMTHEINELFKTLAILHQKQQL